MVKFDPIRSAAALTKQIRFNSVLNTLLWALAFQIIFLAASAFSNAKNIQTFLMYTVALTLIMFLVFYAWLLRKNPNLLRSEGYNYQMAALEKFGSNAHTVDDVSSLPSVTSPALPSPDTVIEPTPEPDVPEQPQP